MKIGVEITGDKTSDCNWIEITKEKSRAQLFQQTGRTKIWKQYAYLNNKYQSLTSNLLTDRTDMETYIYKQLIFLPEQDTYSAETTVTIRYILKMVSN